MKVLQRVLSSEAAVAFAEAFDAIVAKRAFRLEFRTLKPMILFVVAGLVLVSCIVKPPLEEQLLTGHGASALQKSGGNCSNAILYAESADAPIAVLPSREISVLDWNIYKGNRSGWEEDLLRLGEGSNIIFLQEVSLDPRLQGILRSKKWFWSLNNAFFYKGNATGVLLASTAAPLVSCGQRTTEPFVGLSKTVVVARYAIEGSKQTLLAANLHAINLTLGTGVYGEQFDALEAILAKHQGPLLVAGDFNNWSTGRLAIMTAMAGRLALKKLDFGGGRRTTFWGDPVDQIFYRGLRPLSHFVHLVESSDHNPISATFQVLPSPQQESR